MKPYFLPLLLLSPFWLCAQFGNMPLTATYNEGYAHELFRLDSETHTSIQPWNSFEVGAKADAVLLSLQIDKPYFQEKWLGRKLVNEHFIHIKKEKYNIIANPIMNLSLGKDSDLEEHLPYRNTRGFQVMGNIGKTFTFYTDFYENQALFPTYLAQFIQKNKVIPGEGRFKLFKEKGALDYGYASSHITYQPNEIFNFQVGHGKHFLGDGYRSLLLSDNAFNYPYFRITAQLWKFKYWVLYTKMLDTRARYADGSFLNKYITSHYLSYNITKRWSIGLFETVIYGDPDGTRGYDINYLNPLIFYRPIEFALGSSAGNALLGLNLKYKVTDQFYLYGQFILDEFKFSEIRANTGWWANKYGFQLGFKSFNTIVKGLTIQSEINSVRPFTYSHFEILQNYGHYNQALAHPLGSNFVESVSHIRYQQGRWRGELELVYAIEGRDTLSSNWGTNIYRDYDERSQDYGNQTLQGVQTTTILLDAKAAWIVNPSYNLRLELGYRYRQSSPETIGNGLEKSTSHYIYFGLATRLSNIYADF